MIIRMLYLIPLIAIHIIRVIAFILTIPLVILPGLMFFSGLVTLQWFSEDFLVTMVATFTPLLWFTVTGYLWFVLYVHLFKDRQSFSFFHYQFSYGISYILLFLLSFLIDVLMIVVYNWGFLGIYNGLT